MRFHGPHQMILLFIHFLLNFFSFGLGVDIEIEGTLSEESALTGKRRDMFDVTASMTDGRSKRDALFDTKFHFDGKMTITIGEHSKVTGFNTSFALKSNEWSATGDPSDDVEYNRIKRENIDEETIDVYALLVLNLGHGDHQRFSMRTTFTWALKSLEYTPGPENYTIATPKNSVTFKGKLSESTPGGEELFNLAFNMNSLPDLHLAKREVDEVKFKLEGEFDNRGVRRSGARHSSVIGVKGETTLAFIPNDIVESLPQNEFENEAGRKKLLLNVEGEFSAAVNGAKQRDTLPLSSQLFAHARSKREVETDVIEYGFNGNVTSNNGRTPPSTLGLSWKLKFWVLSSS